MEMGNVEMGNGTGATPAASGIAGEDRAPVYAGRLEIRPADNAALVDGRPGEDLGLVEPRSSAERSRLPMYRRTLNTS